MQVNKHLDCPEMGHLLQNVLVTCHHVTAVILLSTFWIRPSGASVCDQVGAKYRTGVQDLLDKVLTYDKLNLILLLDVSGSIGNDLYRREVERFGVELMEHGIRKSGMIIHPDHAHVEILTFDDLANIQEYRGGPVHACGIYSRLQQIHPGDFNGRTEVHNAFNTTRQLFRKRQRPGDKKVLFLVTDGGFTSPPAAVRTSVGQLHALGVEIFTIGVGRMSSSWVIDNLDTVVLDTLHFLCYSTWSQLVRWTRATHTPETTWAAVTESQEASSCPACVLHSTCMCAVNIQRYMCNCNPGRYMSSRHICEECPFECPEGEPECPTSCYTPEQIVEGDDDADGEDKDSTTTIPHLTLIIALSAAMFTLLLVILIVLLVLVRWKRYKNKNKQVVGMSVTHAFINFISLKKVFNMNTVIVNDKKVPMRRDSNPYVIDTSRPSSMEVPCRPSSDVCTINKDRATSVRQQVQLYEARGQTTPEPGHQQQVTQTLAKDRECSTRPVTNVYSDCARQSTCSSHTYTSITPGCHTDEEGYQLPVSHSALDTPPDNTYENVANKATEHAEQMSKLVDTTDIDGAAVFCKADDSLVTVGNLNVRSCDVTHVMRLLGEEFQQGSMLPVDGTLYQVQIHHTGNSLYAEEMPGGKDKNAIWIINTDNYLTMAKGIRAMALQCEQSIAKFALELEN